MFRELTYKSETCMCCRMPISRAFPVAEAFGLPTLRLLCV